MSTDSPSPLPCERDWRLRPYRPGDERLILAGFQRIYGRAVSEATWHWKLRDRPSPAENVWVAIDRSGRPIFHYAGIPCRLRLPAGTFDALVAVDLWTLPEYRRRGIFTRCAAWIHDRWRRAGIVGLLGAPNEQFGSRDRFLGWRRLFPLRWQIRPLRPQAIAARRLGLPQIARLRGLDAIWNLLWNRGIRPASGIEVRRATGEELGEAPRPAAPSWGLERGVEWLRWRYLACPRYAYTVLAARRRGRFVGYLVYRIEDLEGRRFAFVAELLAAGGDSGVRDSLILDAVARLRAAGAVAVATLAVPSTDLYRAWRRRGFVFSWGSFGIQCLPFSHEMSPDILRDPRRWDLAGGDLDVI